MKILLLNPPGSKLYIRDYFCSKVSQADYLHPPIDFVMLSGLLRGKGNKIYLIDSIAERLSRMQTLSKIGSISPDVVIMLVGSCSWLEDREFSKDLRTAFTGKLIGIGDICHEDGRQRLIENPQFDAFSTSFVSPSIKDYLSGHTENTSNMILKEDSNGGDHLGRMVGEFSIGSPIHSLFQDRGYRYAFIRSSKFTTTLTEYGCPFVCSFCIIRKLGYAKRPIDEVVLELQDIGRCGIEEIFFLDQTFGMSRERLKEICRWTKRLSLEWICFSRIDVLDEESIRLMSSSGCHTIIFGVESGDERILKEYRKGYNIRQIQETFKICKRYGIRTVGTFIIGLPEDTPETIEKTIRFSKKVGCDYASFNVAVPRMGTDLRKIAIEKGLIDPENDVMDQSGFDVAMPTNSIDIKRLSRLRQKAVISFYLRPHYIFKRVLSIKSGYDFYNQFRNAFSIVRNLFK